MRTHTVGDILKRERVQHNLSIVQLSKKTRIRTKHLEALEENRYQDLPASVFIKGYIKAYAETLGFDYQPVIALLRRDYKESAKGTLVPREFLKPLIKRRKQRRVSVSVMVVVIIFCTVGGYLGFQWYSLQKPPTIDVFSPQEQAVVGPTVSVIGQTDPDARLEINDQPVALQVNGSFDTEIYLEKEGVNTIIITAYDEKNRSSKEERIVYVQF